MITLRTESGRISRTVILNAILAMLAALGSFLESVPDLPSWLMVAVNILNILLRWDTKEPMKTKPKTGSGSGAGGLTVLVVLLVMLLTACNGQTGTAVSIDRKNFQLTAEVDAKSAEAYGTLKILTRGVPILEDIENGEFLVLKCLGYSPQFRAMMGIDPVHPDFKNWELEVIKRLSAEEPQ